MPSCAGHGSAIRRLSRTFAMLGIGGSSVTFPRSLMPGSPRTWRNARRAPEAGSPRARPPPVVVDSISLLPPREYLEDFNADFMNATKAAISAGYARASARQAGHRLLRHPAVRAAMLKMHQERIELLDEAALNKARTEMYQAFESPVTSIRLRAATAILDADRKRRELDLREREIALRRRRVAPEDAR